jgi:GTP cyclohydrolase I
VVVKKCYVLGSFIYDINHQHMIVQRNKENNVVDDQQAKEAVKTLLRWIGDDPEREGLIETPDRVIKSFKEYFAGYKEDPGEVLKKTFTEASGYSDIVLLKNINIYSHCEHHMAPVSGTAHVAYYPNKRIVGISKLGRVVDILSKKLQVQERLTNEIARVIDQALKPKGVAIYITAKHSCMRNRGVCQRNSNMQTYTLLGCFRDNEHIAKRFFSLLQI